MNKIKTKHIFIPIIVAILSVVVLLVNSYSFKSYKEKNYLDFLKDKSKHKISTVYLTESSKIRVKLSDGYIYETDNPRINNFKENLLKSGISVKEYLPSDYIRMIFSICLTISAVSILFTFLKSSSTKNKRLSSIDALDVSSSENIAFTFKDIAGNEEAKESIQDVIDFLKNPEKYSSYNARMPKGIILYGEPGTGKTLLAKAVAGEANVPFYAMSGSDFVQIYVGVGASRIRQLFKKARSHKKAVIFIDEIDAIGKKRENSKVGGSDERDQTLNALLTEMSGFNEESGIIVIAATNRLDMLDSALLRPGRFDRHIEVALPDLPAREEILSLYLKDKPTNNIDPKEWAKKTAYFSGAKLENLVNESAIIACKENSPYIEDIHLDKAFSIVVAGYEKKNRSFIKENDRKITAYHEVGHTLLSLETLPNETISKVTIIPSSSGAGGYTLTIPEDNLYQNNDYLKKRMMVLLGGRASEELIFGKDLITTGAHNDLKQCTNIAFHMITEYGMGEAMGLLSIQGLPEGHINKEKVVEECKNLVEHLYEQTKNILLKNMDILHKISNELISKETITESELKILINS